MAKTVKEREIGLMNRPSKSIENGMFFPFYPSRKVAFWMYKTFVPLDIIFLRSNRVVAIKKGLQICSKPPCPIYNSGFVVDGAVELVAGKVDSLDIKVGEKFKLKN